MHERNVPRREARGCSKSKHGLRCGLRYRLCLEGWVLRRNWERHERRGDGRPRDRAEPRGAGNLGILPGCCLTYWHGSRDHVALGLGYPDYGWYRGVLGWREASIGIVVVVAHVELGAVFSDGWFLRRWNFMCWNCWDLEMVGEEDEKAELADGS